MLVMLVNVVQMKDALIALPAGFGSSTLCCASMDAARQLRATSKRAMNPTALAVIERLYQKMLLVYTFILVSSWLKRLHLKIANN